MTRFTMPISEQIWGMKYQFKDAQGNPIDQTVEDTWTRIAKDLARPEGNHAPDLQSSQVAQDNAAQEFYDALEDWKYTPAGRIVAGAGTERAVTLFNCYVMGTIPDSMSGIFEMLREAALTMQQGGGIGYDFSTIRPKSSLVKKLGADASGPLSFMDCWDAMCRTVMSAGSRRGAMMATMRCDHPDIMDFITAKSDAARLRMFNLSVLVTDAFMEAVEADGDWFLMHVEPPKTSVEAACTNVHGQTAEGKYVHGVMKARDLWDAIMENTYAQAEPGVIFIDRINEANNLRYCETIAATNPCGEQPLPPYGACLLGSVNLAKLVENPFTDSAGIDQNELRKLVHTAVRMMDNVVEVSNFPLPQQEEEAKAKRRIGLGVTGLADALIMCKLTYGSPEAIERTEQWMKLIDHEAYAASVALAQEKGAFPLFDADKFLAPGTHASTLDAGLQGEIRKHGIRNALLTSIAPTGTISLYAGNVSSGIEPVFAYSYTRKVLQPDGSRTEELVEDYAVAAYRKFWEANNDHWDTEQKEFDPDFDLPDYFVSAQTLPPEAHVLMQAAAQKWVDSSISKTINCPEDISFEDFKDVYMQAWHSGCKGCTTYRPNEITGSVLSVEEKPKVVEAEAEDEEYPTTHQNLGITAEMETGPGLNYDREQIAALAAESLPDRPEELEGSTYKIKVGDQKAVYLTINDTVESNGTVRPFEIFLRSSDPEHDEWMVTTARLVSAIMRRPHDSSFVGAELMRVTSATTGGFQKGYGYRPSLVAAIGAKIKEHTERSKLTISSPPVSDDLDGDYIPEFPRDASAFDMGGNIPAFPPENLAHADRPVPTFTAAVKGRPCKECGSYNFKHESGCATCLDCGWSKCS